MWQITIHDNSVRHSGRQCLPRSSDHVFLAATLLFKFNTSYIIVGPGKFNNKEKLLQHLFKSGSVSNCQTERKVGKSEAAVTQVVKGAQVLETAITPCHFAAHKPLLIEEDGTATQILQGVYPINLLSPYTQILQGVCPINLLFLYIFFFVSLSFSKE